VHSIDYILKPINEQKIAFAINKYKSLNSTHNNFSENNIKKLISQINKYNKNQYNESLLVHYKNKLIPVHVSDIVCFYIEHGIVYILTKSNKSFSIDKTLDKIEQYLDPDEFKRANRQCIISRSSIVEIEHYFNGRYMIKTSPPSPSKIIISKGRSSEIIKWIGS
jgi:two-component system LytT family response regulator